jgi:hypothetical protein
MKLREVINEVCNWMVAIHLAQKADQISAIDAIRLMASLRNHVRAWLGEDLLNTIV